MEPIQNLLTFITAQDVGLSAAAWGRLRENGGFFRALQAIVTRERDASSNVRLTDAEWSCLEQRMAENVARERRSEHAEGIARAIAISTKIVSRNLPPGDSESDRLDTLTAGVFQKELVAQWLHVTKATLENRGVQRSGTTPVAFKYGSAGALCKLELELLENDGPDVCAFHPGQLLDFSFNDNFLVPMADAWTAALDCADAPDADKINKERKPMLGRWRLIPWIDAECIQDATVEGSSLTAAAARGWSLLLTGKVLDPRVLVMAKVIKSKTGWNLGPIDGVTAKMKAVCKAVRLAVDKHEESPIDRIAVVSGSEDERNNKDMPTATNVTDARTAISKAGLDPWTDVVDISTLQPPSPNERVEPLAYA